MTTETIVCADGFPLTASVQAGGERGAVIFAPALGVPRRLYEPMARYLHSRGFSTVCFDNRGFGDSRKGPMAPRDMRMQHWGERDLEAVLRWARETLKPSKLFLVGHSAGGQVVGLAPASQELDGMVFVASTAPHASLYPMPGRLGLLVTWWLLIPLLCAGRDWFPARQAGLGSGDLAAAIARQWAAWARKPGYLFHPSQGLDTARYAALKQPLLNWSFSDDNYAPPAAVEDLLRRLPAARITRRLVDVKAGAEAIGHFGFFRERNRDSLWKDTADWLAAL